MTTNCQYRFTNSSPILAELSRDVQLPPPHAPLTAVEKIDSLDYIDKGLGLLGHLHRVRDDQLHKFITEKFKVVEDENGRRDSLIDRRHTSIDLKFSQVKQQLEKFRQEVGQRFEEVGQRFEEVGQRFEEVGQRFEEVGQRFEEVGQRFDEMNARMFNSLSYRAHHEIHPVTLFERGRGLQQPDSKHFPRTIKHFWRLQLNSNSIRRLYLLQFYHIEGYKQWKEDDDEADSDSSNSEKETLTLEQAVRVYPLRCLEALAARLGLNYDNIAEQMQRQSQQIPPTQRAKRTQEHVTVEQTSGQPSKKLLVKPQSIDLQRSNRPEAEQEQDSHVSIDILPETVDLTHRPREQKSTVKTPARSRDLQPEERSHGSTETISSTEHKKIIRRLL